MRCLVTTSQAVLLVDFTTGTIETIRSGDGPYYGLTWSVDHVYVTVQYDELMLEIDSERRVDSWPLGTLNVHGAHFDLGQLYVCDTGRDSLRVFDSNRRELMVLPCLIQKYPRDSTRGSDQHHLNTVWAHGDEIWVTYHNWDQPSIAYCMTERKEWTIAEGGGAHDFAQRGPVMYACDSRRGMIIHFDGHQHYEIVAEPFLRGLAVVEGGYIVGVSQQSAVQSERLISDGALLWLDVYGHVRKRVELPGYGQVLVVRAIDVVDWAHHGEGGPACPLA